ncbi:MAG: SDR family NAD(P)-dependent oxidoreductase [Gammaproteobacteria bacterium]|nr:SDR family NAD(P)-dependent oxidoreductase [Gammaproteobacteria bacterium]
MKSFEGRIAVVTGGGTGMGRELVVALAGEGCHVALCDVSDANMEATRQLAEAAAPAGTRVSTHHCDVSDEQQMLAFRDEVAAAHGDCIHLLFNNAGIGGGGSLFEDDRAAWDKTFAVCWGGVLNGTRAFLSMLTAADAGHIVNTSSINGFWAFIGPESPHTAYSAAKFAVKGFTEALITDLRIHAPHVKASVVMPGHIGTQIVQNSMALLGRDPDQLDAAAIDEVRQRIAAMGLPVGNLPDADIRELMRARAAEFESSAPTSAAEATKIILDGVRAGRWRILVGEDAVMVDQLVRADPENAYEPEFLEKLTTAGHLNGLIQSAGAVGEN